MLITIPIGWSVSAQQSLWPLPGLYFIEMVALSLISAVMFVRGDPGNQFVVWGAVGIFSAFSIIGAWSVGFFYLPVTIIFGMVAILSDLRKKQLSAVHFGGCLLAGIAQAVLMFAAIGLLNQRIIF